MDKRALVENIRSLVESLKLGSGGRFSHLVRSLSHKKGHKGIHDIKALAAAIGRKKYGNKKMAKMAAAGHHHKG